MDNKLSLYLELSKLFEDHGFSLYLVGGTVRDYLLGVSLSDMDLVTNAKPDEMKIFLDGSYKYSHLGNVSFKYQGVHFDVTTLRKEKTYSDYRHPMEVEFVDKLEIDVVRRDFTINALYMDKSLKVYDFVGGKKDLENRVLRIIGDPKKRLEEDPLRIIRAARFAITYKLSISPELKSAILDSVDLLNNINPEKIKQDLRKMKPYNMEEITKTFDELNIHHILNML